MTPPDAARGPLGEEPTARSAWRGRATAAALYVAVAAAGLWFAFQPTLATRFRSMQSDPGDCVLHNYLLEHVLAALGRPGYVGTLWSPPFFHPAPDVLAYSENLLGAFPLYALLRLAVEPTLAYQGFTMLATLLSFASFVAMARGLGVRPWLSAIGGFVFAFGAARVVHVGHPQLLVAFYSPLALLALVRFLRRPGRGALAALLALLYLQLLASVYLGWLLGFGAAVFALLYVRDREVRARVWAFLRSERAFVALALVVFGGALAATFWPYVRVERRLGSRPWEMVLLFLPSVRSWVTAPAGSLPAALLPGVRPEEPFAWEHCLFPGFVPVVLAAVALRQSRADFRRDEERVLIRAALYAFAVLALLSLAVPVARGPGGSEGTTVVSAWRLVYELVPGAKGLRAVGRIWSVSHLFLLLGGVAGAERALSNLRAGARRGWAAVALAAGIAEQVVPALPSFDKSAFEADVAAATRQIGAGCSVAYLPLPPDRPFFTAQLAAMWAGLRANVPVVNGYSGASPPGYPDPTRAMTEQELRTWLAGEATSGLCVLAPAPVPGGPR